MIKIVDERERCDLECLAIGAFRPLTTYMTKKQYESCLDSMKIDDASVFPIPIMCSVKNELQPSTVLELRSQTGIVHAVMIVEECWQIDLERECNTVFGTFDPNHPYIQYLKSKTDKWYVSGSIEYTSTPYHNTFLENRRSPTKQNEQPLIGFQTRNPLHRSHIELINSAAKKVPNASILLHPVEGVTQDCDVPFPVRMKCYQEVLPYLPPNSALSILPLSMRMAGPREAVWHAIIRRNYGCTHFIVGRDHAGPSYKKQDGTSFYEPMAAQQLALQLEPHLGIQILPSEEVVYCENMDTYVELSKAPADAIIRSLSGTQFRTMLETNTAVPAWYSYPGVINTLQQYYQRPKGTCYYFVGLSGSGKSTMAEILKARLEEIYPHRPVTLLDADIIRLHLSKGLGFSKEDRSMNVRRIGYVASEIVKHGGLVVVANIAPYEADRTHNRQMISQWGRYVEIYVNTPLEECERRDVKGIYAGARAGTIKNVTGINDPFEIPNSDLMLELAPLEQMTKALLNQLWL